MRAKVKEISMFVLLKKKDGFYSIKQEIQGVDL